MAFGRLLSRSRIEQQALATLQSPPPGVLDAVDPLLVYLLAEVERREGLQPRTLPVPPGPSSYRGGVDFEAFEEAWAPVITVAAEPVENATRYNEKERGEYEQAYELQVAATVMGQDEDSTRLLADRYGIAVTAALLWQGGLGTWVDSDGETVPFASKTVMRQAPKALFVRPAVRRVARSISTLYTYITGVVSEQGPIFGANPYTPPTTYGLATDVEIDLHSEDLLGNVHAQDGGRYVEPVSPEAPGEPPGEVVVTD